MNIMVRIVHVTLSGLKYVLATFMMYAGATTAFGPIDPYDGRLDWMLNSRISLMIFGTLFFISGLTLFLGKVLKKYDWTGRGLMMVYLSFLFAALVNTFAIGWNEGSYNFIAAMIVGALYLRWKHHFWYFDAKDVPPEVREASIRARREAHRKARRELGK